MQDLEGKVAVVTGAARGIGRGIALTLARHGADVVVTDVDEVGAADVAAEMADHGRRGLGLVHDVTDRAQTEAVRDHALEEFGQVDILVNNAGVSRSIAFMDIADAEWDRVTAVNVKGTYVGMQIFGAHMIERKYGKIVNLSSMAGKEAFPTFVHYSAAKFAVMAITQGVAKEFAEYDINVNAVCPGVVRTPLWEPLLDQMSAAQDVDREDAFSGFIDAIPLKRPQTAEDIGEAVAFLASDRAKNITGQGLNVSGGIEVH